MPKKEEFPTFLNQQPTVIFGRTGRELLVIVVGIVSGYLVWAAVSSIRSDIGWMIISGTLAAIPPIVSLVVALFPIADKPLEEWFFTWAIFTFMPKIYLFKDAEEDVDTKFVDVEQKEQVTPIDLDELDD